MDKVNPNKQESADMMSGVSRFFDQDGKPTDEPFTDSVDPVTGQTRRTPNTPRPVTTHGSINPEPYADLHQRGSHDMDAGKREVRNPAPSQSGEDPGRVMDAVGLSPRVGIHPGAGITGSADPGKFARDRLAKEAAARSTTGPSGTEYDEEEDLRQVPQRPVDRAGVTDVKAAQAAELVTDESAPATDTTATTQSQAPADPSGTPPAGATTAATV